MKLGRAIYKAFCGKDNVSLDIGRILLFEAVQMYMLVSMYALYKGNNLDFVLWGAGLASLLGAGMGGIGLKAGTEPEAMMIKSGFFEMKQARGRALPSDDDAGGTSSDDPTPSTNTSGS